MLKSTTKALIASALTSLTYSGMANGQSTPAPGHEGHDHSAHDHNAHAGNDHAPVEIQPGTFAETEDDHAIGNVDAPQTMIIYASVTCPHCAQWFKTVWPDIKKNYVETDKLRVVFREFPTAPAQLAFAGFLIANCAPEDQYFEMIEHQMAEQDKLLHSAKLGVAKEAYLEVAKKAGLKDEAAMNECLANKEEIAQIQTAITLARSGKIQSVPNFIIGGELYKGKSELAPLTSYLDKLDEKGFTPLPR